MTEIRPVPAFVKFQQTGVLPPIDYSWVHLIQVCRQALTQGKDYVILPVMELPRTKKNKVRLEADDKISPKGLVLRNDQKALEMYAPYAPARFSAEELALYAAKRFNDLAGEQITDDIVKYANTD